jgi:hypothetical protein
MSVLMDRGERQLTDEEERQEREFLQRYVLPEEVRRQFTTAPSRGFRWFASPNIVDLERYRRRQGSRLRQSA